MDGRRREEGRDAVRGKICSTDKRYFFENLRKFKCAYKQKVSNIDFIIVLFKTNLKT